MRHFFLCAYLHFLRICAIFRHMRANIFTVGAFSVTCMAITNNKKLLQKNDYLPTPLTIISIKVYK